MYIIDDRALALTCKHDTVTSKGVTCTASAQVRVAP